MSHRLILALAVLAGRSLTTTLAAAQASPAPADSTAFVTVPAAEAAAVPPPVTALDREVAAIREAFSGRLAGLTAAYRAAPDAATAARLQSDIVALKAGLELDLLDLQLRLARERNDAPAIAELQSAREAAGSRLGDDRRADSDNGGTGGQEASR